MLLRHLNGGGFEIRLSNFLVCGFLLHYFLGYLNRLIVIQLQWWYWRKLGRCLEQVVVLVWDLGAPVLGNVELMAK